ncbi:MAG: alpha-amylase family glycosyl hydrolase [Acidobacteriaceae bacterium]
MIHHFYRRACGFAFSVAFCLMPPLVAGNVSFPDSPMSLAVSNQTGALQSISVSHRMLAEAEPERDSIVLFVGGTPSRYPLRLRPKGDDGFTNLETVGKNWHRVAQSISDTGDATVLRVESREGDWWLAVDYRILRQAARMERRFHLRYEGPGEVKLRSISVTLPTLRMTAEDRVETPGSSMPPSLPLGQLGEQVVPLAEAGPGLFAVRNPQAKTALLCWAYSETEVPHMVIERGKEGLQASYRVELADRMTNGKEISWGSDYLWFLSGEWNDSLAGFQHWWDQIDVSTPRDRPRWTEKALLYETQIGAAYFNRGAYAFNPYPTIQSLIDKLDYIHGLGFNTLQLMPQHPSPSYAVDDYFNPSRQYGKGFERLVEECHKRGMRIIVDWLVHGVIDKEVARKTTDLVNSGSEAYQKDWLPDYVLNFSKAWLDISPPASPLRAEHPDWFMKLEDGSTASIYTWAFDLENSELQSYIIDAMKFYVGQLKVDGFRVDAPDWNDFPNWDPKTPYRPSYAETGSIRLFDRARIELHKLNPDIMLYTEPSAPMYRRMFDVNYAYGELWLYPELLSWHHAPGADTSVFFNSAAGRESINAHTARVWFEDLRNANPAGAKTIHQVDSHDSFWWPAPGVKFRREQFGPEGYRALFFTMAMLDGGLMQYPTAEQGNEGFVKRVLMLRTSTAEIADGQCYYLLPEVSSDSVFAVGWKRQLNWVFPMTNFSKQAVKVRVQLKGPAFDWKSTAQYQIKDIFNGLPLNGKSAVVAAGGDLDEVEIELQPLQSALIAVQRM